MSDEKLGTQVRRQQIAQAALELVANHGMKRLRMAAVARRVGLVPSGIYRHFANKDEMLSAVLDLVEQRLGGIIRAARAATPDPVAALKEVLVRHMRFVREGRAIPRMIFSDEIQSDHPQRRRRVHEILAGYLAEVAGLVREGQDRGQVRPELDPDTVALMFLGMIVPAAVLWHVTEGEFDATRHAQRVWPLFRAAITGEGSG
jgi:AcrR family transcriptional regulator